MNPPASILVIDDEPTNFDVIETFLSGEEYELHYAASGQRVLDRLDRFNPDVILLDLMMPDLDGIEVCRLIRAMPEWQHVPIVMVTALTGKTHLARAIEAGADDFMNKPISHLELRARVHSMLRIKRQHDQLVLNLKRQEQTIHLLQNGLDELRENVIRSLPHELNTPLNGVLGLVDLLMNNYTSMDAEEVQEILQYCKLSAQRMDQLTQQFLAYVQYQLIAADELQVQQIRTGKYQTHVESALLPKTLAKAKAVNRFDDLSVSLTDGIVILSPEDLNTLFEEIIDNAFKFSEVGTAVQVMGQVVDHGFQLSVSNQGRTISPEQIQQIGSFMQFDRHHYEQQGVGLGLATVKEILNIYGGSWCIESQDSLRTTVSVTLPLHQSYVLH